MASTNYGNPVGLKVVQICHDYEGPFQSVCQQYSSAFTNGHFTTLFLRGKPDKAVIDRIGGDEVIFLDQGEGALRGIKWATIFQVFRLFKRSSFDLVIAHRYKAIYLAGLMSYFFPLRLILGVAHEHKVFSRVTRSLFVMFWRKRIVILGVSESVTRDVESSCPGLRDQGRLYTLNNGIDIGLVNELQNRIDARRLLGVPAGDLLLGTIGRLVTKKNHALLLRAFSMADLPEQAKLLFIGSGPEERKLRTLCIDLEIDDQVIFSGHVPDAFKYLRALDVFVFPSGDAEAFGIVLLEAMLAEVPIVSSDASGPAEVVRDSGWLFNLSNVEDLARVLSEVVYMPESERRIKTESALKRVKADYSSVRFSENLWRLKPLMELDSF